VRIAVLIKQVPEFEAMRLGPDGRLQRDGLTLEMNPYCRRAVSKGVELAKATKGSCTVFTLGPPSAEDALREAIAWGADDGVLVTDPAFAGSDTLATARALAPHLVGFDLILCGRNSVDADTGQVPPQIAELLDMPFVGGARTLTFGEHDDARTLTIGERLDAHCEHDDGWLDVTTDLPAVVSCAERLCDPAKVEPEGRAAVDPSKIRRIAAAGEGPWGQAGSPTHVGDVRLLESARARQRHNGSVEEQVRWAIAELTDRGATSVVKDDVATVPEATHPELTAVLIENDRPAREILNHAARLGRRVIAISAGEAAQGHDGADEVVILDGSHHADDVAPVLNDWCQANRPWAVLALSTMWGREVMSRVAARQGAGLTGDAVDLSVRNDRLVAWKPAFGGSLVAAITATSSMQMATVRPGVLPLLRSRAAREIPSARLMTVDRKRVRVRAEQRDDNIDALARAEVVIGVGAAVSPDDYPAINDLCAQIGAELGATRKVTDKGWLPRSRQIGLTGRSIGPRLYIAIGISGKFNHMVGVRGAGAVLAINPDPDAPIWDNADVGIQAAWQDALPLFVKAYAEAGPERLTAASSVPR
jgi:electron transfer flavoprotein alpha subunit